MASVFSWDVILKLSVFISFALGVFALALESFLYYVKGYALFDKQPEGE
jgi:hypothetical protein